jgi:hypothetical protein
VVGIAGRSQLQQDISRSASFIVDVLVENIQLQIFENAQIVRGMSMTIQTSAVQKFLLSASLFVDVLVENIQRRILKTVK